MSVGVVVLEVEATCKQTLLILAVLMYRCNIYSSLVGYHHNR